MLFSIVCAKTDFQGEVIDVAKETLNLTSCNDIDSDVEKKFALPGSKYSFFKDTMLKTLVSKKEANWKEYQREKRKLYASDDSEVENEGWYYGIVCG